MRNVLFSDTITIWNYYIDPATRNDAWQRTVLRGVQYRKKTEKSISDSGVLSVADVVSITIPDTVDAGGRQYIAPGVFATSAQKPDYWTLNPTSNKDVLVLGEVSQEIGAGYTLAKLKAEYIDSYATIKSVSVNMLRPRLKHWKVVAV